MIVLFSFEKGVKLLSNSCQQLRSISFVDCSRLDDAIFPSLLKLKCLDSISFNECRRLGNVAFNKFLESPTLHLKDLSCLGCPQLVPMSWNSNFTLNRIVLESCNDMTLQILAKHKQLLALLAERYEENIAPQVSTDHVRPFQLLVQNTKTFLRHLKFCMNDNHLKHLADNCEVLEKLHFLSTSRVTNRWLEYLFLQCKQLKELFLCVPNILDDILQIISTSCQSLQTCCIENAPLVSNKGIGYIIADCRQLEKLMVYQCPQVEEKVVSALINHHASKSTGLHRKIIKTWYIVH